MERRLVTITAPHYTASIIIANGVCTEAAPILRWAIGKTWRYLHSYFGLKGYRVGTQDDPALKGTS